MFGNGPTIVTNGLVLALDAGDRNSYVSGSTTWFDLTGVNNGTLTNGPTFNSGNGGSIVFDGIDDYITTPITSTYQVFTFGCWFYNTTSSKSNRTLISKNSYYATTTNDWPVALALDSSGSAVTFLITSGTSYSITTPDTGTVISASLSSLNTWYYVSANYNKSTVNLYINGLLVNSQSNTISLPNNTARVYTIGRQSFEYGGGIGNSQYNGNIAQVSIYNRALSADEVLQNYNATKGRFGL